MTWRKGRGGDERRWGRGEKRERENKRWRGELEEENEDRRRKGKTATNAAAHLS
jgi:hypothetical protein